MTSTSTSVNVGAALSEGAIRDVNFFNGRLVTSRDMTRTLAARREADARLGQGIGAGIVQGLEVGISHAAERRLAIGSGLAVSRAGQTLCLGAAQVLALVPSADAAPAGTGGFGACGPLSGGSYVAGNGLYLLTLAPIALTEGKAPVLALEPGNARCNTDVDVDAVQFRLLRIDQGVLASFALDANPVGAPAVSRWRSALAHACFGSAGLAAAHGHAGLPAAPGLLDAMRRRGLADCDVPLALVYLTASEGIMFVDTWAVRRRVAGQAATLPWSAWLGPELDALGEAQLAQFQDQLAAIPAGLLAGLSAADWFTRLPPAGFLDASGARQLDWNTFLGERKPARSVALAAGDVRAVLAQALRRDPVLLAGPPTPRMRVYRIGGDGPWLFLREAPNAPHAEEIWLDGERASLPGVSDVQSAIDALRARGCDEVSLRPGGDLQARIDALAPGSNVRLCFEAGDYKLSHTLHLRKLGHVVVHGSSAGSRLHCDRADSALHIEACASVTVSDMAFSTDRVGRGGLARGKGILGALTVSDVPQVHIQRVTARCGPGSEPGAGAIVVRQTVPPDPRAGTPPATHACIADCELQVGAAQLGILCLDFAFSDIRGNRIHAIDPDHPPERGIVVAGSTATQVSIAHNTVVHAAQGIALGLSRSEESEGKPLLTERALLLHNTVTVALDERDLRRNRFGLFVGNAESLLLDGNRITMSGTLAVQVPVEAIRLTGVYGRHLVVRASHMGGARTGIAFTPLAPLPESSERCLWLFDGNLAEQAGGVIVCSEQVRHLLRSRDNLEL